MELTVNSNHLEKVQEIDNWGATQAKALGCKGDYKGLLNLDKNGSFE